MNHLAINKAKLVMSSILHIDIEGSPTGEGDVMKIWPASVDTPIEFLLESDEAIQIATSLQLGDDKKTFPPSN